MQTNLTWTAITQAFRHGVPHDAEQVTLTRENMNQIAFRDNFIDKGGLYLMRCQLISEP